MCLKIAHIWCFVSLVFLQVVFTLPSLFFGVAALGTDSNVPAAQFWFTVALALFGIAFLIVRECFSWCYLIRCVADFFLLFYIIGNLVIFGFAIYFIVVFASPVIDINSWCTQESIEIGDSCDSYFYYFISAIVANCLLILFAIFVMEYAREVRAQDYQRANSKKDSPENEPLLDEKNAANLA